MPLYLLARIDDEPVALFAEGVRSVVELGPVTPVPRASAHVLGLCALRSRVVTVIDPRTSPERDRMEAQTALAIVVEQAGYEYAVLVDRVEDVIEAAPPLPCSAALAPRWRAIATGLIEQGGGLTLLVDPAALIDGRALAAV